VSNTEELEARLEELSDRVDYLQRTLLTITEAVVAIISQIDGKVLKDVAD
jgi:hypothetical protein